MESKAEGPEPASGGLCSPCRQRRGERAIRLFAELDGQLVEVELPSEGRCSSCGNQVIEFPAKSEKAAITPQGTPGPAQPNLQHYPSPSPSPSTGVQAAAQPAASAMSQPVSQPRPQPPMQPQPRSAQPPATEQPRKKGLFGRLFGGGGEPQTSTQVTHPAQVLPPSHQPILPVQQPAPNPSTTSIPPPPLPSPTPVAALLPDALSSRAGEVHAAERKNERERHARRLDEDDYLPPVMPF